MTDRRQHAESTTLCTTLPHSSSSCQNHMYVRIMACPRYAAASCLRRSLPFVTPPYRIFMLCCRCLRMFIDCAMVSATSPGLGFPHPLSPCTYVRLKIWRGSFFRVIFDFFLRRSQTTSRQHAESTTTSLPHSSSDSSRQNHVCAHGVSSLCCGEFFVSEPTICHPSIPHILAVLP